MTTTKRTTWMMMTTTMTSTTKTMIEMEFFELVFFTEAFIRSNQYLNHTSPKADCHSYAATLNLISSFFISKRFVMCPIKESAENCLLEFPFVIVQKPPLHSNNSPYPPLELRNSTAVFRI